MYDWEFTNKLNSNNHEYNSFWEFEKDRENSPQIKYSIEDEDEDWLLILAFSIENNISWDVKIKKEHRAIT